MSSTPDSAARESTMEFGEVIRRRRMVRRYDSRPVGGESLERILRAALSAPSAGNAQGQSLVVITNPERRASLATAAGEPSYVARGFDPWISSAPVLVVICVEPGRYRRRYSEPDKADSDLAWDVPYWWVDGGATLMTLLLGAVEEGLGAGFLGGHAFEGLPALLGLPDGVEVLGVVTLGTPAPDRPAGSLARGRSSLKDRIHFEAW